MQPEFALFVTNFHINCFADGDNSVAFPACSTTNEHASVGRLRQGSPCQCIQLYFQQGGHRTHQ